MKNNPIPLHHTGQHTGDFGVQKGKQRVTPVHNMNLRAERGERAGVFAADYPGANHRHLSRQAVKIENRVRIVNLWTVEGKRFGTNRRRSDRDQDVFSPQ